MERREGTLCPVADARVGLSVLASSVGSTLYAETRTACLLDVYEEGLNCGEFRRGRARAGDDTTSVEKSLGKTSPTSVTYGASEGPRPEPHVTGHGGAPSRTLGETRGGGGPTRPLTSADPSWVHDPTRPGPRLHYLPTVSHRPTADGGGTERTLGLCRTLVVSRDWLTSMSTHLPPVPRRRF